MRTSPITGLSEPENDDKISAGTLAYISTRIQARAYTIVIQELKKSGITQAQLARRLGKGQDVVSRLLSRPRNWELKTFSDLLFAISGAVLKFSIERPLDGAGHETLQTKLLAARSTAEEPVRIDPPPQGTFRITMHTTGKVAA